MLCLISVFWIQAWNVLPNIMRKDNICRKNVVLVTVRVFIFQENLFLCDIIVCSLSNSLLCNHLVRRRKWGCAEKKQKLIMFCDKVYILFSNWNLQEVSCIFFSFMTNHVLFLPESREMSLKKNRNATAVKH